MERDCFFLKPSNVLSASLKDRPIYYIMGDYGLMCLGSVEDKVFANIIVSALNNLVVIRDTSDLDCSYIAKSFLEEISDLNPKKS